MNLREASKNGIPAPREGYEQRKVIYKKYNDAVIKGWSKRVDDGREYTDKDFILCERKVVEYFPEGGVVEVPSGSVLAVIDLDRPIEPQIEALEVALSPFEVQDDVTAVISQEPIDTVDIHNVHISEVDGAAVITKDTNGVFVEVTPEIKKKRTKK